MSALYQPFVVEGTDINSEPITKTVKVQNLRGELVMGIAGFDCDYTYITKEQAMKFFGLVEPKKEE